MLVQKQAVIYFMEGLQNMTNVNFFIGAPQSFNEDIEVYPPLIKDLI